MPWSEVNQARAARERACVKRCIKESGDHCTTPNSVLARGYCSQGV